MVDGAFVDHRVNGQRCARHLNQELVKSARACFGAKFHRIGDMFHRIRDRFHQIRDMINITPPEPHHFKLRICSVEVIAPRHWAGYRSTRCCSQQAGGKCTKEGRSARPLQVLRPLSVVTIAPMLYHREMSPEKKEIPTRPTSGPPAWRLKRQWTCAGGAAR